MSLPLRSASPCITSAMRAASRRLTLLYDEVLAPSGLRITQFGILAELGRRVTEPPTVSELAQILTMERSALGQTLRPLERDGLIKLGRDKSDRRRRSVQLTSAGHKAAAKALPYWESAHGRFANFFGNEALKELRTVMRDIAENPRLSEDFEPRNPKEPGSHSKSSVRTGRPT